ncbi:ubiquitin specific peptidase, putative [Ichthyophthirius multifiliis]|uniref:Ubiquitin carboxyl-terminal hydrolase n=1 Tax=Ichthyophthirius multifiliis TaxID=5932 RepID=G0QKR6_ICHMU|nr:ubiquitin specific peptidase, putative [Ichthyophthirius multifiliis]EGR34188.1 ubiquitin specific peptidase, putative [Ichthyophthirius multifiliis]|eukprot:XP_004039492.1 ubiquitin specific peptidase, putative [Ichthyophthirius multifiliis]
MVKVTLKWGTQQIEAELNIEGNLEEFQKNIYQLTQVPPQSQKIIYKGTLFKEGINFSKLKIENGAKLTLMGAPEERQIKELDPSKIKQFIEEMTPEQIQKAYKIKTGQVLPVGLANLGNTCYMNSSIQCLRKINELKNFMLQKNLPQVQSLESKLGYSLQSLFKELEKGQTVQPFNFVSNFMSVFPQFAEKAQGGEYKQQDADECFQNIVQCLEPLTNYEDELGNKTNLIKDLLQIDFEVKYINNDNPDDYQIKTETAKKLMCTIDNQNNPINQLTEGINISLQETVQKNSQLDNQTHSFSKITRIKKLPSILSIQMVRFFWKQKSESSGTEATKSKILRNVAFPRVLDIYPYCCEELQKVLDKGKEYEKNQLEANSKIDKFEQYKQKLEQEGKMIPEDTKTLFKQFKEENAEEEIKKHDNDLYRQHGQGLETGAYELIAVLTHQGRSADSGHYVAWVHLSGDTWCQYNDNIVTEHNISEIMDLRGGGDRHMAYYLIYRKLEVL